MVVIGILIALQMNNNNEARKERNKERQYLVKIKSDLQLNIAELQDYINVRAEIIVSANTVLEHFEDKPISDLNSFNNHIINIYT